ncbi:hypothetical protein BC962_2315 [Gillisia mitskevichiae]|uniref:Uncharacterized protein n=1 Tax=Gillisia mitskevichiae TaxID=270921 RepID=A0A495PIG7_9FLAO|nr:hypothetical protein [Gillisia mitskevichiae]RKS50544.1 hypothetical protein BC962_2315 [Gillisia mitskevichiae]
MATFTKKSGSANEKNVDELISDTREWDKKLQTSSEEINFLSQFITADIFQKNIPNLYENLFAFSSTITTLKNEKIELHQAISNHKNDLIGMFECEDISCETFYFKQHEKLENRLMKFLADFDEFQKELFKFCTNKLRMPD